VSRKSAENRKNTNGKLLKTVDKGWFNPGQYQVSMDISFLDPGLYLVETLTDQKPEIFKLVKK